MEVHVVAFQVLLDDGVVAFGVASSHHHAAVWKHGTAVVFEPEPFGAFDPDDLTAGLLFCFLLLGAFQLSPRRFKRGDGS